MEIKLFIDDLRPIPKGWAGAASVTEAIRILAQENVVATVVSMDHDIALTKKSKDGLTVPIVDQDGDLVNYPENFSPVAHYISAMPVDRRPTTILVHTANLDGAQDIINILKDTGIEVIRKGYSPKNYD